MATQSQIADRSVDIAELAREHYALVYRFCARRVGSDLAADVAQETFLTAQRRNRAFHGRSAVTTWLVGIAFNECRRALRTKRREPPPIEIDLAVTPSAEAALIDRHALQQAMNKLSPDHREVVLLHELDGLTYEEAAKVLGVPVGTVKSRSHHAFVHLRRTLE
ncbi:MAG TPA: RNA polymerase sigma factor, partial [Fimbriimonadaceae bacterium]|nr:RNA polymerase sigma factor [Fimbriimonadaceae bacterium]